MFSYHFMVNAFRAGTVVAVVAGVVGWFMVLRAQSFAGHTLSIVGFPGAIWLPARVERQKGDHPVCAAHLSDIRPTLP